MDGPSRWVAISVFGVSGISEISFIISESYSVSVFRFWELFSTHDNRFVHLFLFRIKWGLKRFCGETGTVKFRVV